MGSVPSELHRFPNQRDDGIAVRDERGSSVQDPKAGQYPKYLLAAPQDRRPVMTAPLPQVPVRLREMLKDYPEQMTNLQELMASFAGERAVPSRYEELIWALESRAGRLLQEARAESKAAKEKGDLDLIAKTKAKEMTMGKLVLQAPWSGDRELMDYFGK